MLARSSALTLALFALTLFATSPAFAHCGKCGKGEAKEGHDHAETAEKAELGEAAPNFTLPRIGADTEHSLSDFQGKPVVLVWQSIRCPWNVYRSDSAYERVLYPMAEKYGDQVQFIAINSNHNESDEDVAAYIEKNSTPYPVLRDEGNKVADAYAARTTPHVYVIDAEGKLVYRGGIEETPGSPKEAGQMDEQYLAPVLDAVLAGEDVPFTDTKSKGCSIKRTK